jgi:hypothetical protein
MHKATLFPKVSAYLYENWGVAPAATIANNKMHQKKLLVLTRKSRWGWINYLWSVRSDFQNG